MADIATHLLDRVLPHDVPVRQWVLSVPKRVRFFLHRDRRLLAAVGRLLAHELERALQRTLGRPDGRGGSVGFPQRFGSTLNAHPHVHALALDGLYVARADGTPTFVPLPHAATLPLAAVTERVRRRVLRLLVRRGCLEDDAAKDMLAWAHSGFSIHATVRLAADDRAGLERLVRYCARPPFADRQLSLTSDGRVRFRGDKPGPDGQRELVLDPLDFLDRLVNLLPPSGFHLTRFYGVLSAHALWRSHVVPPPPPPADSLPCPPQADAQPPRPPAGRPRWAQLIARTYGADALRCEACGGKMKIVAFLLKRDELRRFLSHLGQDPTVPDLAPARGPPTDPWDGADPPVDEQAFLDPPFPDEPA